VPPYQAPVDMRSDKPPSRLCNFSVAQAAAKDWPVALHMSGIAFGMAFSGELSTAAKLRVSVDDHVVPAIPVALLALRRLRLNTTLEWTVWDMPWWLHTAIVPVWVITLQLLILGRRYTVYCPLNAVDLVERRLRTKAR